MNTKRETVCGRRRHLDIDEDVVHPVERLPCRRRGRRNHGGEFVTTRAQLMPSYPPRLYPFNRDFFFLPTSERDIIENRSRRYSAPSFSLPVSPLDGESDASRVIVPSGISLTTREPISAVNRSPQILNAIDTTIREYIGYVWFR